MLSQGKKSFWVLTGILYACSRKQVEWDVVFCQGLNETTLTELACRDDALTLDLLIDLAICLDNLTRNRKKRTTCPRANTWNVSLDSVEPMQLGISHLSSKESIRRKTQSYTTLQGPAGEYKPSCTPQTILTWNSNPAPKIGLYAYANENFMYFQTAQQLNNTLLQFTNSLSIQVFDGGSFAKAKMHCTSPCSPAPYSRRSS